MNTYSAHFTDSEGNPTGGHSFGTGFAIGWQHGLINYVNEEKVPNGAQVEDVLEVCMDRLQFFQESKFNCEENVLAIRQIQAAINSLIARKVDRVKRGVGGTLES